MIQWKQHPAVVALSRGEVIAYPTEAVWGLGCDPFSFDAVAQILAVKQRPVEKGLILVASSLLQLGSLLESLEPLQIARLEQKTVRPTTWLIPHFNKIPAWITGGHDTVAIRLSKHPIVVNLCDAFGGMLVSTSANPAGLKPAATETEARAYFSGKVSHYVQGEIGESEQPSDIIDLVSGKQFR